MVPRPAPRATLQRIPAAATTPTSQLDALRTRNPTRDLEQASQITRRRVAVDNQRSRTLESVRLTYRAPVRSRRRRTRHAPHRAGFGVPTSRRSRSPLLHSDMLLFSR